MVINLLDWKFWLILIIIIIIVRWLYVRAGLKTPPSLNSPPSQEEGLAFPEEARPANNDPEEVFIVPSWIPPLSPLDDVIPPDEGQSASREEILPILEVEEYKPDLCNNGNSSIGEHLTSEAFKVLTRNAPIVRNARPSWLTNPKTGYPLEMDVFCPSLGCGVEYNGVHHYQYPNVFNKTQKDFENQLERDLLKRQLADRKGIPIFTVPCTVDSVVYNEVSQNYVNVRRSRQERYNLIFAYLKTQLTPFLQSKGQL